jgi:hypothetical protein
MPAKKKFSALKDYLDKEIEDEEQAINDCIANAANMV